MDRPLLEALVASNLLRSVESLVVEGFVAPRRITLS
jgi:hypothetical protein